VVSGAITAEVVASKNERRKSSVDKTKGQSPSAVQSSFVRSVHSMQIDQTSVRKGRSQIMSGIVRSLTWHNTVYMVPRLDHEEWYNLDDSYLKQMFCTPDDDRLFCHWCLQARLGFSNNCTGNVVQCFKVCDTPEMSSRRTMLKCVPSGRQQNAEQFKVIMAACAAPTNVLQDCPPLLYAAAVRGDLFAFKSVAVLDAMDQTQTSDSVKTFGIGKKWAWSCVWCHENRQFAVGTEKLSYLFDANTGRRFVLETRSSDVLSQAFTVSICLFVYV